MSKKILVILMIATILHSCTPNKPIMDNKRTKKRVEKPVMNKKRIKNALLEKRRIENVAKIGVSQKEVMEKLGKPHIIKTHVTGIVEWAYKVDTGVFFRLNFKKDKIVGFFWDGIRSQEDVILVK